MTQQPVYPGQPQQGYPQQYPQQGYPAQPQQPYPAQPYPAQPYPAQPQPYAPPMGQPMGQPQGYPQQAPQGQPGPVAPPVQSGSIDDYYSQPVAAGGPGISWKDKPIGTSYAGVISGNPTVQQDSDYTTKLPKFQRDGVTPQWVMLIPLERVQSTFAFPNGQPEFPTGEVVFYARGKDKEELARAMAEAGCSGAPQAGAVFQVTLVERKPQRQGNPKNVVRITYTPAGTEPGVNGAAAAVPQAAPAQQVQPQMQMQAPAPQPMAQQIPAQATPPEWAQQAAPVAQQAPQQAQPQQMVQPQPPAGMSAEQQAIIAGLTGGAQG